MNKIEKYKIYNLLNEYENNNLVDNNGKKINNTIQALLFIISELIKENEEKSTCPKKKRPILTSEGYQCNEDHYFVFNPQGFECCYKNKKTKKSKISTKRSKKRKTESISSKINIEDTNIFSMNHKLEYLNEIIEMVKIDKTSGYSGRNIEIIPFENIEYVIKKHKIYDWYNDVKSIKLYDTVTINFDKGLGEYLVVKYKKDLALIKNISEKGYIFPFECINAIEHKKKEYQELTNENEEKSTIFAIHFFLDGEIRDDKNFYIPISKNYIEIIKNNKFVNITTENNLLNSKNTQIESFFVIDVKNSRKNNNIEIILVSTDSSEDFIPEDLIISFDKKNIDQIKNIFHIY